MSGALTKHLIDRDLLRTTLERARAADRKRTNFNFHGDMQENPHRFLNVMLRDTYITPHRHLNPPKAESFLIIEGSVAFFTFEDDGTIVSCDILTGGLASPEKSPGDAPIGDAPIGDALGIDISPGYWHTLVVLSEYAICFEVKPGPYQVSDDKEFAAWAPREGQATGAEILAYQKYLREHVATL